MEPYIDDFAELTSGELMLPFAEALEPAGRSTTETDKWRELAEQRVRNSGLYRDLVQLEETLAGTESFPRFA